MTEAMKPVSAHRADVAAAIRALAARPVELGDADGCVLAEDLIASGPLPEFDNSAMDGYAVIAACCKKGARLRVMAEQPAGIDRKLRVSNGEAIRIFTGAPILSRSRSEMGRFESMNSAGCSSSSTTMLMNGASDSKPGTSR